MTLEQTWPQDTHIQHLAQGVAHIRSLLDQITTKSKHHNVNATDSTVSARQAQRKKGALWTGEIMEGFQAVVRL